MKRIFFPFYKQFDSQDCGTACIQMISSFYGKKLKSLTVRKHITTTINGVTLFYLERFANKVGFETKAVKIDIAKLYAINLSPCIVHWQQNHFIVVYKIKKNKVYVADTAVAKLNMIKKNS